MKIFVCIKQVPDTGDIKWTENNTMVREGVESITNPCDVYAIETGVKLGMATAVTMGPPQAENMLRNAIAAGCKNAVLLSDKKFAAADTLATARTLAAGLKKLGHCDLVVCGQYATDGDTAQTGPNLANFLDLPQVTYVKEVLNVENGYITVKRELDRGTETVRAKLPALICVLEGDFEPKRPLINDTIRAQNGQVIVRNADDLGLSEHEIGIKGSPTYVNRSFRMTTSHEARMVETIDELAEAINEAKRGERDE